MATLQIISVLDFLKPLNLNSSGPHIVSNFNLDISLFKIIYLSSHTAGWWPGSMRFAHAISKVYPSLPCYVPAFESSDSKHAVDLVADDVLEILTRHAE